MQHRTIMALATAAGLTTATGVLALGAALFPSSGVQRPADAAPIPIAAVPEETSTTIVTDYQDVYDVAPPAAAPVAGLDAWIGTEVPPASAAVVAGQPSDAVPAPPPTAGPVPAHHDDDGDETEHDESEDDHDESESSGSEHEDDHSTDSESESESTHVDG